MLAAYRHLISVKLLYAGSLILCYIGPDETPPLLTSHFGYSLFANVLFAVHTSEQTWADPEWGQGVRTPLKNKKNRVS